MWESNKEIMYNMQDALISAESLAMLAGTDTTTGIVKAHKKEVLTANSSKVITIEETPVIATATPMFIFLTNHGYDAEIKIPLAATNGYEITGSEITFDGTVDGHEIVEGDQFIVDYYYDSEATAKNITIEAAKFPGYYKVEADTVWTREHDGAEIAAKFTMPRVKISSSFNIENAAEGDPSAFDFIVECFPDSQDRMVVIDVLE